MTGDGFRICDVGTDHGYVPIQLVLEGKSPYAIAMDINKGPLLAAKEHVDREGLSEKIDLRLSDGLEKLKPGETDTIVIAGMGGALMQQILTKGEEAAKSAKELILQPQSEWKEFREFLHREEYKILSEEMLMEEGKYYLILLTVPGKETSVWSDTENRYGKYLLERQDPVLKAYLSFRLSVEEKILSQLEKSAEGEKSIERKRSVKEEIERISKVLKGMKDTNGEERDQRGI